MKTNYLPRVAASLAGLSLLTSPLCPEAYSRGYSSYSPPQSDFQKFARENPEVAIGFAAFIAIGLVATAASSSSRRSRKRHKSRNHRVTRWDGSEDNLPKPTGYTEEHERSGRREMEDEILEMRRELARKKGTFYIEPPKNETERMMREHDNLKWQLKNLGKDDD